MSVTASEDDFVSRVKTTLAFLEQLLVDEEAFELRLHSSKANKNPRPPTWKIELPCYWKRCTLRYFQRLQLIHRNVAVKLSLEDWDGLVNNRMYGDAKNAPDFLVSI